MSRLGWLAGIVVGVLLMAGCSGDGPAAKPPPSPPPAPGTTPVTTTSPTPAPEPPSLPAAARQRSEDGAVAFAHHYIELINFSAKTGSTQDLRDASGPRCDVCDEIAAFVARVYQDGGVIRGGAWKPRSYSAVESGRRQWLVAIEITAGVQKYRSNELAHMTTRTGGKYTVSVYSAWRHGGWRVQKLVSTR